MFNISIKQALSGVLFICCISQSQAQQKILGLKEAEQIALANYGAIKARTNQLNASKSYLNETRTEALPNVSVSAQNDYGTVNGQNGPLFGYSGLAVSSSGPVLGQQNYNAAFGALYLGNINWEFFAFGKARERIKVQGQVVTRDASDLEQEKFQHQIRVASTYLNLLAAQQLAKAQLDNLNRTLDIQKVVIARVKNGLNPGVDSSLANAEVSNARIAYTNAQQTVADQNSQLVQYLGVDPQVFVLDSVFIKKAPNTPDPQPTTSFENHPELLYLNNRIKVSDETARYLHTFAYPSFSFFSTYQGRGSGFLPAYSVAQTSQNYTGNYGYGVDPTRFNYLVGIGVTWNLTQPFRVHYQVESQKYTSLQLHDEYELVNQQLRDQEVLAVTRINNALKNYREAPTEVKAATDAYNQKSALYKNGLATIVDYTQALYTLNRAEVDLDITLNNVWQAVLSKAAASGDFSLFFNNF
jgi:outer membrane protein TolC